MSTLQLICSRTSHLCGYSSLPEEQRTWQRVETTPATTGNQAVYQDQITGLKWSRGSSTSIRNWQGGIAYCNSLSHGGIDTWRLPTHKELLQAYAHGIYDLDRDHTSTHHLGNLATAFWSSTTRSTNTARAWTVDLHGEYENNGYLKTNTRAILCVAN